MIRNWVVLLLWVISGLFFSAPAQSQQQNYDLIISGARIVDGTGAPWIAGDIGIVGDHIAAIGDLHAAVAKQKINAAGLVAAPGFIDVQGQSEFNRS
jgi:dihydroorotase/N-acyl-D-amino-acid deacylase